MKGVAIVLLCIVAACIYGIVHDQITARICVEYFTICHPPVFNTDSPTLLGIGWGILATWWVGLLLGIGMAWAARSGSALRCEPRSLVRPIFILLCLMAGCALLAGAIGFVVASQHWVYLVEPLASNVPARLHIRFLTDLWAHGASYLSGFVGGLILIVQTRRARLKSIS